MGWPGGKMLHCFYHRDFAKLCMDNWLAGRPAARRQKAAAAGCRCATRKRSTNENESSKFAEQSDSEAAGNAAHPKKSYDLPCFSGR